MDNPAPDQRRPRRLGWILAGVAALIAATTATGIALANSGPSGQPAAAQPNLAAPAATTSDPAPTPSTAPAKKTPGPAKLGQKQRLTTSDGLIVEMAALKVRHGADFEGVQVRTCNRGPEQIGVSRGPWSLSYDNFEQLHDIDVTGGGLPAPDYPSIEERWLSTGECVKGWINYSRVDGERPDGIQYAPPDTEPFRWTFDGE